MLKAFLLVCGILVSLGLTLALNTQAFTFLNFLVLPEGVTPRLNTTGEVFTIMISIHIGFAACAGLLLGSALYLPKPSLWFRLGVVSGIMLAASAGVIIFKAWRLREARELAAQFGIETDFSVGEIGYHHLPIYALVAGSLAVWTLFQIGKREKLT